MCVLSKNTHISWFGLCLVTLPVRLPGSLTAWLGWGSSAPAALQHRQNVFYPAAVNPTPTSVNLATLKTPRSGGKGASGTSLVYTSRQLSNQKRREFTCKPLLCVAAETLKPLASWYPVSRNCSPQRPRRRGRRMESGWMAGWCAHVAPIVCQQEHSEFYTDCSLQSISSNITFRPALSPPPPSCSWS